MLVRCVKPPSLVVIPEVADGRVTEGEKATPESVIVALEPAGEAGVCTAVIAGVVTSTGPVGGLPTKAGAVAWIFAAMASAKSFQGVVPNSVGS